MFSICKKVLEKISSTEKMLSTPRLLKVSDKCENKRKFVMKQDAEAIEEFKALKDNMCRVDTVHRINYSLAYQPITIKSER